MIGGEDWLMRPIVNKLCAYESLHRTELTLLDFAIMNDALDVDEENRFRVEKALSNGR